MIADTSGVDCMIIRQNEIGVYDTSCVKVSYFCKDYVRLKTGESFFLQNKEKLIEESVKCQKIE